MLENNLKIGGDFGLIPDNFVSEISNTIIPIKKKYHYYFDTGRSAIYTALLNIKEQSIIDSAWVPYFICQTVIKPFIELGFKINFYGMGSNLDKPKGLPSKLSNSVFLFTHYFGKTNKVIMEYIDNCIEKNVYIIEDCVQGCLSPNLGQKGDFIIHSLRKFLPLPDGGILESNKKLNLNSIPSNEKFVSNKIISKLLRGIFPKRDAEFLKYYNESEKLIEGKVMPREMSLISSFLLKSINLNTISKIRKKNWKKLHKFFQNENILKNIIAPLFNETFNINTPLVFPVIVNTDRREKVREYLYNNNIYCPVHWDLPFTKDINIIDDYYLSRKILSIPIDQRISDEEFEYLIKHLKLL